MSRRSAWRHGLLGPLVIFLPVACVGPFDTSDFLTLEPVPSRTHEIDRVRFEERWSRSPAVTVDEAEATIAETVLEAEEPPATISLSIEEVRAAALAYNLDLQVDLVAPSIARSAVDAEEAKFEAVFNASAFYNTTDSPTAVATEGTQVDFTRYEVGFDVPLRTGGTIRVNLPVSKTASNNPFATLDPAYDVDLTFSISQPILRGGGNRVNTHSIRLAKYQASITDATTKLRAIGILAGADRAYWALYALQRALEVAHLQYELAYEQQERARRRFAAGDVANIEILRARSGVAQRLENIIVAENGVRQRRRDLKRIMQRPGLAMESETALELGTSPSPLGLDLDPVELSEFAIENRMEMLELELPLAIDASTIDFRRNATLPALTLDTTYTRNGLGQSYSRAFNPIPDGTFEDWTVGLSAQVPIGNEAAYARLHGALLQRIQRISTREQRRESIRQEVFDAVDRLRQDWQRILAARQEVLLAAETLKAEQNQFEQGASTSTNVLDQATRLADAQLGEIRAVTDYQVTQVDLALATGTLLGYGHVQWEPRDTEEE